jgi:hypothetical protein
MHRVSGSAMAAAILTLGLVAGATPATADEPLFGYVYATGTQPKGTWEVEQWITDRDGQAHGHFHALKMATELEYGVTNKFQLSGYLHYSYEDASGNSVRGLTEGIDIPYDHNSNTPYHGTRFDGVSVEALYRVMSPYIDPIGLAFIVEPEFIARESGLELRAIVQKNFLDDRLVFAGNAWVEFEREAGSNLVVPGSGAIPTGTKDAATYGELDFGVSYRFMPDWSVGLEFRNHNEWDGWTLNHSRQDHTAFFIGPDIHYAAQHWWVTLSALHQLPSAQGYTPDQAAEMHDGYLYGDEHTSWDGIRLKVGYEL